VQLLDALAFVTAGTIATFLHFHFMNDHTNYGLYVYPIILAAMAWSFVLHECGGYSFRNFANLWLQVRAISVGFGATFALLTVLAYAAKLAEFYSRSWSVMWIAGIFVQLILIRLVVSRLLKEWAQQGLLARVIAIVGGGKESRRFLTKLRAAEESDLIVVGIFDDRMDRLPPEIAGYKVMGTTDDLISLARSFLLDEIVIALPLYAEKRIGQLVDKLRSVPSDLRLSLGAIERFPILGLGKVGQTLTIEIADRPLKNWARVTKRIEDTVLGTLLFIISAPLMGLIALAIRFESPGPALFVQPRFGFNNELISVLKFRTMYTALSDRSGACRTVPNDPRVTRVGRFLRKLSLDELPQLINVLRGEMSLVGPRPHVPAMKAGHQLYHEAVREYFLRHHVLPGMTGWAQVNHSRGEIATLVAARERVAYDLFYIEHWSVWMDLKIMLLTVRVLVTHKNAY
jgi:Undecaprenyl-phosphate glucose phosphotransferase